MSRTSTIVVVVVVLLAAWTAASRRHVQASSASPWVMARPLHARQTGTFRHPKLVESSGVAASRRQPGILWTINDSGNEPLIFATDTMGLDKGAFRVVGAENEDWEAIALGPCDGRECLYICDTGDNSIGRANARLYRIPEPSIASPARSTRPAEALDVSYPGGARDVEAAFVGGDGELYLLSKGRAGAAQAYRVPASAWGRKQFVAQPIGGISLGTESLGSLVTDAAISPDRLVAVRTYLAVFFFRLTPAGTLAPTAVGCGTAGLQLQGEGISWLPDSKLVLTSEGQFGRPGTIVVLECRLP